MSNPHLIEMLQEDYSTVGVHFLTGSQKSYTYKVLSGTDLNIGDHAVVSVAGELKIVRVHELHDTPQIDINSDIKYKWIICKVDTAAYEDQMSREEEFRKQMFEVEKTHQRKTLTAKLREHLDEESSGIFDNAIKLLNGRVDLPTASIDVENNEGDGF